MRVCGHEFERLLYFSGQTAQSKEPHFVSGQLRSIGQRAMNQQMRDFGKFAVFRKVSNVVSAIVQIVAALAHSANRRLACDCAGERDGFLGFECGCVTRLLNAHGSTLGEH